MDEAQARIIEMVRRGEYSAAKDAVQALRGCSAAEAWQQIESVKAALARPVGKGKK